MRIPLSGKTVPFRVVKRRGRGFSSVVFECERCEQRAEEEEAGGMVVEEEGGGGGGAAAGPRVVTVKVHVFFTAVVIAWLRFAVVVVCS